MNGSATRTLETALRGAADSRPARFAGLTDREVALAVADCGVVAFDWHAAEDRFRWSANAAAVLGLDPAHLPRTARAFRRLLTPATAPSRGAGVPAIDPASGAAPADGYRTVYAFAGDRGAARLWVEETGHWFVDDDGGLRAHGLLAVIPAPETGRGPMPATNPGTGLVLRDGLMARLAETITGLAREGKGTAAFLVIAVDGLARVNAGFGYEVGDAVITTVARRIGARMRQGDVLGHLSGHKFGAILNGCSETMLAFAAERFLHAVADEAVAAGDALVAASISIGAALVPRHAGDAETAILRAEEALAVTRAAGGNTHSLYAPSAERDRIRRRNLDLAEETVRGLAEGRFLLAYQPIVSTVTGAVLHYEALSRLVRRDGVVVSAGDLIATAERLGLVDRIDRRSLALVVRDLTVNPRLALSVNVSAATLVNGAWMEALVDAIRTDRTIAGRLTVEITETAALSEPAVMRRAAETLRDVGCKVAIDDFGVGHTSLKGLRDLEIDWLKIDGSFVRDIAEDPDSAMFVRTLVGLADHLGVPTVAEWVEGPDAARVLADLGVVGLQGRHAGLPRLRVPEDPEVAAVARAAGRPELRDGYPAVDGLLEGPLACG